MSENSGILSSVRSIADAIAGKRAAGAEDATAPEAEETQELETAEGAEAEPEPEEEAPASGDHEEADEPGQGEEPEDRVLAPPSSWPKDQSEEWNALSDRAKELILAREQEAQAAISEKGREAAEARRNVDAEKNRLNTDYQARIAKLDELIPKLAENAKSRFESINWTELARDDPERFVALRAEADETQKQLQDAAVERQRARREAEQTFQQEQYKALLERNPQYKGEEGAKTLAAESREVEAFARTLEGVTDDHLRLLSADVYEALRDAMKFRKATKPASVPQKKQTGQKTARPGAGKPPQPAKVKAEKAVEAATQKAKAAGAIGRNAQDKAVAELLAKKRAKGA